MGIDHLQSILRIIIIQIIILWNLLILLLSQSWRTYTHLNLLLSLYIKGMFSWNYHIKRVFCFKSERSFKNYLREPDLMQFRNRFLSPIKIKIFVIYKNKLPKKLYWGLIHRYMRGGYSANYYVKTNKRSKSTSSFASTLYHLTTFLFWH